MQDTNSENKKFVPNTKLISKNLKFLNDSNAIILVSPFTIIYSHSLMVLTRPKLTAVETSSILIKIGFPSLFTIG